MNIPFLHESPHFKDLIEAAARDEKIKDPSLVEKDYWLMHALWGLQQLKFDFHLKGGTSLSKGYGCIHRFSEDIDLKIEPNEADCGFKIYAGKNHDSEKHRKSREKYFQWICDRIHGGIPGIVDCKRDQDFDDQPKLRGAGIRLLYNSQFSGGSGLKEGILLEVGFDRTAPNQPCSITSWAYEKARSTPSLQAIDNRAIGVLCYEPQYTFVEKLQAVVRKFRHYKEVKPGALPSNFIRHYYDLYQLIERSDVQAFIGTQEYEDFKSERFGNENLKIASSDAFTLSESKDRALFETEYSRSENLYFRGRPSLSQILDRIRQDLDRL